MTVKTTAGTSPMRQSAWSGAEDRGFEPRRVVTPNRISSAFPVVPARRHHVGDRTETQASAPETRVRARTAGNARHCRARCVHAPAQVPGHSAPPVAATSAMISRPTTSSLGLPSARAFATSGYCNRSASPITGLQATRVCDHGSRKGTDRDHSGAGRGRGTSPGATSVRGISGHRFRRMRCEPVAGNLLDGAGLFRSRRRKYCADEARIGGPLTTRRNDGGHVPLVVPETQGVGRPAKAPRGLRKRDEVVSAHE
jgi:hypothetical protein